MMHFRMHFSIKLDDIYCKFRPIDWELNPYPYNF